MSSIQAQLPPTVSTSRTLLKTHKGAAKRWRKTGSGHFKRVCEYLSLYSLYFETNLTSSYREKRAIITATLTGVEML